MTKRGNLRMDEQTYREHMGKRGGFETVHRVPAPVRLPLKDAVDGPGAAKHEPGAERKPYFQMLMALLRPHGIPEPLCEYRFDAVRKWRFDFAWPDNKLAVEIDGGLFVNGGHNRGAYLLQQMAKQNAAMLQGWTVLRYSPNQFVEAERDIAFVLCLRVQK